MNLRHLVFFHELAKTEHMAKAANNLGISEPSLSYAINKLEQELGVPLFEKDGRNIKLTFFGKTYLQFVEQGLTELNHGQKVISQLLNANEGCIHLGFTYTLGEQLVPELVTNFQKNSNNKHISFEFYQNNTSELLKGLIEEKYDFVLSSFIPNIDGKNTRDKFIFIPLLQQEIILIVPNDHKLAKYKSISLKQIGNCPLIYFSKNSGLRPLLDHLFQSVHVKPNICCEIEEDHTVVGFVKYGYGIALVPHLAQLSHDLVHIVHIKEPDSLHQIYLVLRNPNFLPASASKFQHFVEIYCEKNFVKKNRLL